MINKEGLAKHIDERYNGNLTKFAAVIGLSTSCISHLINGRRDAGKKVISSISQYCNKEKLDFNAFIFLG